MENKMKHLEMIQGVINRMASNSFILKGWCVTLVSSLFAAVFVLTSTKGTNVLFVFIALLPAFIFWLLDTYYLRSERLYIKLYDHVRKLPEADIDFSMHTKHFESLVIPWYRVMWSKTLVLFYPSVILVVVAIGSFLLLSR